MAELHEYRVTLRHPQAVTHVQQLSAPNRTEAIRLSRIEAASMMGGEPAEWTIERCERQGAAPMGRAA